MNYDFKDAITTQFTMHNISSLSYKFLTDFQENFITAKKEKLYWFSNRNETVVESIVSLLYLSVLKPDSHTLQVVVVQQHEWNKCLGLFKCTLGAKVVKFN